MTIKPKFIPILLIALVLSLYVTPSFAFDLFKKPHKKLTQDSSKLIFEKRIIKAGSSKILISIPKSYIADDLLKKSMEQDGVLNQNYVPKTSPECCRMRIIVTAVKNPQTEGFKKLIDLVKSFKFNEFMNTALRFKVDSENYNEVKHNSLEAVEFTRNLFSQQDTSMKLSTWGRTISTKPFENKDKGLVEVSINYTHYEKLDTKEFNADFEAIKTELRKVQLIDWN